MVCTITNLRESIRAREALEAKNQELDLLNDDLSQFAYSASHDLKAPLSTIVGLIKICIEDLEHDKFDEVKHNFSRILEIAGRSAEKVEAILTIARTSRERVIAEETFVETEINNIWTDVAGPASETKLALEIKHKEPLLIERATLRVILENLISNAVRYADAAKDTHEIRISTTETDAALNISVQDNGIGIPEENLDRLFLMFTRLDERSGDGLGLSLVKKQMERIGGQISVSSAVGKGTTFDLIIPKSGDTD